MTIFNLDQLSRENPWTGQVLSQAPVSNKTWAKISCVWEERVFAEGYQYGGNSHRIDALVDLKTGDFYAEASTKSLHWKFLVNALITPIFFGLKTLYHAALPISVPVAIFKTIYDPANAHLKKEDLIRKCSINVLKSLAEIVKTPAFAIVMEIIAISAVLIGKLSPSALYDLRAYSGRLIQKSLENSSRFYFPCFQPLYQVQFPKKARQVEYIDTHYPDSATEIDRGVIHLARAFVNLQRKLKLTLGPFASLVP